MTAFAYVFLFASSLVLAVTAIHSSRTETDHKNSEGPTADPGSKIDADADRCSSEASDGSLHMIHSGIDDYGVQYMIGEGHSHTAMRYWMYPRGKVELQYSRGIQGARVEGRAAHIESKYSKFNPFAHVADLIVEKFEAGMNEAQCSWLVNHIETHGPAGYENLGRAWLKKFLKDNEKEAWEKLGKEGEIVYFDEVDPK
ncbi:hypothetical protein FOZ63_028775 [Perkinsus olseni]|uniref:Uncharacterized protein n=1 Tax=Perkinsus olseni TaxID=32597 RepID=A0A7J6QAE7_PEROL|nr:hypothetical protein FOZ60_006064 [Perkinsus olseni]KAF4705001.1 hypothetical protein FOZ63_028775 [Perkinsus olseni]KAF4748405.1 hypothetical protein FOZ62_005662 [Perkinsus olseni]